MGVRTMQGSNRTLGDTGTAAGGDPGAGVRLEGLERWMKKELTVTAREVEWHAGCRCRCR